MRTGCLGGGRKGEREGESARDKERTVEEQDTWRVGRRMSTCDKERSREGEGQEKGGRDAGDKGRTVEAQEAVRRRR